MHFHLRSVSKSNPHSEIRNSLSSLACTEPAEVLLFSIHYLFIRRLPARRLFGGLGGLFTVVLTLIFQ
jgi:hypothetical protein